MLYKNYADLILVNQIMTHKMVPVIVCHVQVLHCSNYSMYDPLCASQPQLLRIIRNFSVVIAGYSIHTSSHELEQTVLDQAFLFQGISNCSRIEILDQ